MKLAIIGSSPIALEAALRFHSHDASLTWFNHESIASYELFASVEGSWEECTSKLGWDFLGKAKADVPFSWENWKKYYYLPVIEAMKLVQEVKIHQVISVTKRFLAPQEEIAGSSRFRDLFRLIYQLNPEEFIGQQKENDPETYKRLSEEFIQSLQSSLEMYEDFDLVIDLRDEDLSSSVAVTGRALGENRIGKDMISYGYEALRKARSMKPVPELRELCLVGSSDLAAEILLSLREWLDEPRSRLFLISHEEDPFKSFLSECKDSTKNQFQSLIEKLDQEFERDVNEFHTKLREWQSLDDFVQVKIPKPVEPIPRLVFFSGHNVTAVDQLIDRRRIFITLEKPDFRQGFRHPENNHLDLKTLGVDEVLVANELRKEPLDEYLQKKENGFFKISPKRPNYKNGWKEDLNALDGIETNIFKLFSPADSH
jgi:hypothetical protein